MPIGSNEEWARADDACARAEKLVVVTPRGPQIISKFEWGIA